MTMGNPDS